MLTNTFTTTINPTNMIIAMMSRVVTITDTLISTVTPIHYSAAKLLRSDITTITTT